MRLGKTMSWCCLTSGNERSAIEISRLRPSDDGAKCYQNSAALHYFYAPHHHFSFLIPHSNKAFIRDPWVAQPTGNPGLANLNPEPSFPLHFLYFLLPFHAQIVYNRDGSDLPSRVVRRGKGDRDEILLPRHLFIRSEKGNVLRDVSRPHRL